MDRIEEILTILKNLEKVFYTDTPLCDLIKIYEKELKEKSER